MVHNEIDIVAEWVHYHAAIFGYSALHVIDNNSTDGTLEVLQTLQQQHGIGASTAPSYTDKPWYILRAFQQAAEEKLAAKEHPYDFFIPIDVDEFLTVGLQHQQGHGALHGNSTSRNNSLDDSRSNDVASREASHDISRGAIDRLSVNRVCEYLEALGESSTAPGYKMRAVEMAVQPPYLGKGYARPLVEAASAAFVHVPQWPWTPIEARFAKSFLAGAALPRVTVAQKCSLWEMQRKGTICFDHGNHFPSLESTGHRTALVLVHYHSRSLEQLLKKAVGNWVGLGYEADVRGIMRVPEGAPGSHYRDAMLALAAKNRTYEPPELMGAPGETYDQHALSLPRLSLKPISQTMLRVRDQGRSRSETATVDSRPEIES